MNLELTHPEQGKFDPKNLPAIPNKNSQFSGYFLLAMARSYMSVGSGKTTVDRYVCFTNENGDQVWIEKLSLFRPRRWFAFDDTVKIESDEEFDELLKFFVDEGILDPKSRP
jgi:hypothetical protein